MRFYLLHVFRNPANISALIWPPSTSNEAVNMAFRPTTSTENGAAFIPSSPSVNCMESWATKPRQPMPGLIPIPMTLTCGQPVFPRLPYQAPWLVRPLPAWSASSSTTSASGIDTGTRTAAGRAALPSSNWKRSERSSCPDWYATTAMKWNPCKSTPWSCPTTRSTRGCLARAAFSAELTLTNGETLHSTPIRDSSPIDTLSHKVNLLFCFSFTLTHELLFDCCCVHTYNHLFPNCLTFQDKNIYLLLNRPSHIILYLKVTRNRD